MVAPLPEFRTVVLWTAQMSVRVCVEPDKFFQFCVMPAALFSHSSSSRTMRAKFSPELFAFLLQLTTALTNANNGFELVVGNIDKRNRNTKITFLPLMPEPTLRVFREMEHKVW
jgi:hypothetical protein